MSFEDNEIKQKEVMQNKSKSYGSIIGLIVAVGVAAFFAGMYASNINSDQISQEDLDNAIANLELKILQNKLPTNQPPSPVKISADGDPFFGDPDAPITIIEFSDFECPFCARFHIQTLPSLFEEYIDQGKVKLVYRDFPIQSIHANALPAAVAANCANDQGKFKEMHDMIFENQNEWNKQETTDALITFSKYATEIKLEQNTFDSCLTSGKHIDEIRKDLQDGRDYGVSGTPGFFVGNDEIGYVELKGAQPFESFKKVIDAQLEA
ncbi:DsbA family protein [Nitrosopumilus sp. b2]|uniref:DsbA family protein n=1 Tax=Nitrosopumilus sp. b2 TaxID=2109908 RepID=UPI0015F5315B|nr:DsbA family protein [Nitrosopumilus sp. b2]KAF6245099.1 disulfide bond formation protein DsbA [Nitrosopumilus sp. b2]